MTCDEKRKLRAAVRQAGKAVGEDERARISEEIIRRIEESPRFAGARTVAVYAPLPDEVSPMELYRRWGGHKRFALPSIEFGWMIFREFLGEDDLKPRRYGIMEPSRGRIVLPEQIDVMIVPGMAFDGRGNRLGRGGGFYDRYLSSVHATGIHKIGVCMPHQYLDKVPCEAHDVRMDEIVTVAYA